MPGGRQEAGRRQAAGRQAGGRQEAGRRQAAGRQPGFSSPDCLVAGQPNVFLPA